MNAQFKKNLLVTFPFQLFTVYNDPEIDLAINSQSRTIN